MIDLLVTNAAELVTCRTDARGAVGAALRALDVIADGAVPSTRGGSSTSDSRACCAGATARAARSTRAASS